MHIIELRYLWPSFNDFTIKNFAGFRKNDTAAFGTMTLQLIEVFQCGRVRVRVRVRAGVSVNTFSIKRVFDQV